MGWEDYKSSVKTAAVTVAAVWTIAPLLYYSHCEFYRHRELRRREKRFRRQLDALDWRKRVELPATTEEPGRREENGERKGASGSKRAEDEELFAIAKERFASFKIGGRYQNPFFEWHEEGAWEWFFWKLIYRPFIDVLPALILAPFSPPSRARLLRLITEPLPPSPEEDPLYRRHVPDWSHLFGLPAPPAETALVPAPEECVVPVPDGSVSREGVVAAPPAPTPFASVPSPPLKPSPSPSSTTLLPSTIPDAVPSTELRVPQTPSATWIGQSTVFLQLDGLCILTDPIFADRTVDTRFAPGRLRGREVPCALREFVRIDVVLVSHSHYDHLDSNVIDYLQNTVLWLIPLGLAGWFRARGVTNFKEMDWWDAVEVPVPGSPTGASVEFVATPTMHWTARTPFDVNRSLWLSFSILGPTTRVLHLGDTGYTSPLFSLLGRLFGPYSLALLPIGAYSPRWHLRPQHVDPHDAVRICGEVRAARGVGVHWGTFEGLSDEDWKEPPERLKAACREKGWEEGRMEAVPLGKTIVF